MGYHRICRDDDARVSWELLLAVGGENSNVLWIDVGPFQKFLPPLVGGHGTGAEDNSALFDCARRRDTYQSLASSARQDYNTTFGSPVTKHLTKTLLLVASNLCFNLMKVVACLIAPCS